MNKCLERVDYRHFLEFWSLQLRDDTKMSPQLKSSFLHCHIYSLWMEVLERSFAARFLYLCPGL